MMNIIRYISVFIGAFLVLSLTIGTHISKMKCAEGGAVYLGSEVPSCSQEKEVQCEQVQKKVTCCMLEIEKACCPETQDNTCASETELVHFEFETIVKFSELDFSVLRTSLFISQYICTHIKTNSVVIFSGIPPPKLNKPVLSKIQSFLL